ncbi:hypothetical protein LPJ61_005318 [Coemansia biformis]|uniref:Zip-domain-containing protein n=1 Tax=Coemansia biformis TaxID=1286918 RepID=A0A9W7Y916_9FUNG|nr:hypothetical protein LPJ61_005318 [Coemansia biformis]
MSPAGSEADGESTAIHSKLSVAGLSLPIEVKRRALATYILELGIVLYSVLVGLALAMSDSGFLALFIATCFHQFFEGLALGTSLAELYWIKAQLAAHSRITAGPAADIGMPQDPQTLDDDAQDETISVVAICGAARGRMHHAVDIDNPRHVSSGYQGHRRSASDCDSNVANVAPSILVDSQNFVHVSLPQQQQEQQQQQYHDRRSKSRRTLLSIATSFLPEPWLVNPQLEKTIGGNGCANGPKATSTTQPPDSAAAGVAAKRGADSTHAKLPRYLLPRKQPERLPGWWKAWVSALAFTLTTPTGIIIGLALRNVYVPHSQYALLFNGVLQSICTGILVYVGLVTLIFGGFNSAQVKQMPRLVQIMLFVAVYAGASAMASIKIWI